MSEKEFKKHWKELEKHFRIPEVSAIVPYKESTIRKLILERKIAFRKIGRIIAIPESEVKRLLGEVHEAVR